MKEFLKPSVEVITFSAEDVITTSNGNGGAILPEDEL